MTHLPHWLIRDAEWAAMTYGAMILSTAVRTMPEPQAMSSVAYRWAYNFVHALLGNFDKVSK